VNPAELTRKCSLDVTVEVKSLLWLKRSMQEALRRNFATTVEEDEVLLKSADFRGIQAILYR
jgi:hypothetical protein